MDPCFGIVETIDAFYQKLKTGNNAQWHFILNVQNLITFKVL